MTEEAVFQIVFESMANGGDSLHIQKEVRKRLLLAVGEEVLKPQLIEENWEKFKHLIDLEYKLWPFLLIAKDSTLMVDDGAFKFLIFLYDEWVTLIKASIDGYDQAPAYFREKFTVDQLIQLAGIVEAHVDALKQSIRERGTGNTRIDWFIYFRDFIAWTCMIMCGYDLFMTFKTQANAAFQVVRSRCPELFHNLDMGTIN